MKKNARYRKPGSYLKLFVFLFIFFITLTGGSHFSAGNDLMSSLFSSGQAFAYDLTISQHKNTLRGANITLTPIGGANPANTYVWFGPFGKVEGPSPQVFIPDGTSDEVFCYANNGVTFENKFTYYIIIRDNDPSFHFPISGSGSVTLEWNTNYSDRYEVYRADSSQPFQFQKIADVLAGNKTIVSYTDRNVQNNNSYLYSIASIRASNTKFSVIHGAHSTNRKDQGSINYKPIIYTQPITTGTPEVKYDYRLQAADPEWYMDRDLSTPDTIDDLTFALISAPVGMVLDSHNAGSKKFSLDS